MPSLEVGGSPTRLINDELWCIEESLLFPRPILHTVVTFEIRGLNEMGKAVLVVICKA
jgi:hypothetical protein